MGFIAGTLAAAWAKLLDRGGLPDPLPAEPMTLFRAWFDDAHTSGKYDDPNAMTLATADASGGPSARVVLCRQIRDNPPSIVFFTNYESRKGVELDANPRAAAVFYWPHSSRQVRIEGTTRRLPAPESDAYFASRSLLKRLGACASQQSRPLEKRSTLVRRVLELAAKHGLASRSEADAETGIIPRPPYWGGVVVDLRAVELWQGVEGRLHDRARWARTDAGTGPVTWRVERLQP